MALRQRPQDQHPRLTSNAPPAPQPLILGEYGLLKRAFRGGDDGRTEPPQLQRPRLPALLMFERCKRHPGIAPAMRLAPRELVNFGAVHTGNNDEMRRG